jgi:mannose-6-phosphate isomerase-like protein (cupin superfamily)
MSRLQLIRTEEIEPFEPEGHWGLDSRWLVRSGHDVRLQVCDMEADGGAEAHVHDADEQVFYVISGELRVSDGSGTDVTVRAGQALRIPAGVPHGTTNTAATPTRYLAFTYPAAPAS